MKKVMLSLVLGLFLVSLVAAFEITLNSPIDNAEYESNSVNLNVNFNELVKCNYTINGPLPPDSSGSGHGIFKLIPSFGDNPDNYQASPVIGYTDNYNYDLDLKKGYDYSFILRCINQEGTPASKEISFSVKDECTENWGCSDWSDCNNFGQSNRICTDTNDCSDRIRKISKPTTSQTCTFGTCTENWQCDSWSECINNQQTKTCTDKNTCGTTTNKPSIQQSCTVQDNNNEDETGDEDETDENDSQRTRPGIGQLIRRRIRAGVYINEDGDEIRVSELAQGRFEFRFKEHNAETELEIEEETENGKTKFKIKLKNGRNATIKIMPDVASATALARLRIKVCNAIAGCTLELKEVGKNNDTRIVYEAKVRKTFRIFGFIKNQAEVLTQIDAETGEVIETKRPWWAWLASEREE